MQKYDNNAIIIAKSALKGVFMEYKKKGYLYNDFKIFHLKDNSNETYDFHYHDFNKILILISGNVNYSIEGRNYNLMPYDVVFVNAGEVHCPIITGKEYYERIIIYISPEFISSYKTANYDLCSCFNIAVEKKAHVLRMPNLPDSTVYKTVKRLEKEYDSKEYANELLLNILFLEFMIELNRAAVQNKITYVENSFSNKKITEIIDYVNSHLCDDLSVDLISNKFFLNRYYLMHSFREETGYSLGNYINTKRLLLSRELMHNGASVTEACFGSGFNNYSTYSRAYKKCFGNSPREYIKGI